MQSESAAFGASTNTDNPVQSFGWSFRAPTARNGLERLGDGQASENSSLLADSEPNNGEIPEYKAEIPGQPKYRRTRAKHSKAAAALESVGPYEHQEGAGPSHSSSQSFYEGPTSRDLSRGQLDYEAKGLKEQSISQANFYQEISRMNQSNKMLQQQNQKLVNKNSALPAESNQLQQPSSTAAEKKLAMLVHPAAKT